MSTRANNARRPARPGCRPATASGLAWTRDGKVAYGFEQQRRHWTTEHRDTERRSRRRAPWADPRIRCFGVHALLLPRCHTHRQLPTWTQQWKCGLLPRLPERGCSDPLSASWLIRARSGGSSDTSPHAPTRPRLRAWPGPDRRRADPPENRGSRGAGRSARRSGPLSGRARRRTRSRSSPGSGAADRSPSPSARRPGRRSGRRRSARAAPAASPRAAGSNRPTTPSPAA